MQDSAPAPSSQTTTDPPKKPLLKKLGFGVWRADQQSEGYLFLLPSLIGFILFVIFPIIASLLLSFYKWDLLTPAEFIGADNYVELATTDPLMGLDAQQRLARHGRVPHDLLHASGNQHRCRGNGLPVSAQP
jgi:hypothetical protein